MFTISYSAAHVPAHFEPVKTVTDLQTALDFLLILSADFLADQFPADRIVISHDPANTLDFDITDIVVDFNFVAYAAALGR